MTRLSDILQADGGKPLRRYYNAVPGTYNLVVPADVHVLIATIQAAGASGSVSASALGGESGECWRQAQISVTPGQTITVVVGAGGAAVYGYTMGTTSGASGGHSSIAGYIARGGRVAPAVDVSAAGVRWTEDFIPSLSAISASDSASRRLNAFSYGAAVTGSPNASGGAPSAWASGGAGRVASAGNAFAGSLGSGGGGLTGTGQYGYSGKGGDGFVELLYYSDDVM